MFRRSGICRGQMPLLIAYKHNNRRIGKNLNQVRRPVFRGFDKRAGFTYENTSFGYEYSLPPCDGFP